MTHKDDNCMCRGSGQAIDCSESSKDVPLSAPFERAWVGGVGGGVGVGKTGENQAFFQPKVLYRQNGYTIKKQHKHQHVSSGV